jgi:hypothetical protein
VFGNFYVQDNENLAKTDFTQYNVTVPTDPKLPNSGQTVTGFFDPNMLVAARNVIKSSSDFGEQQQHWNGCRHVGGRAPAATACSCRAASAPARR